MIGNPARVHMAVAAALMALNAFHVGGTLHRPQQSRAQVVALPAQESERGIRDGIARAAHALLCRFRIAPPDPGG